MNSIDTQTEVLRQEYKYYISYQESLALRSHLKNHMNLDKHANEFSKAYTIKSLYFDDVHQSDFTEKVDGLYSREKYRVRMYEDNVNLFKFESKKRTEVAIKKTSENIDLDTVRSLINGDYNHLLKNDSFFLKQAYGKLRGSGYKPRVIVEYDREAYCLPYNNIRVTLDLNLRTYNSSVDLLYSNSASTPVFDDNSQILEIKFTGFMPDHLKLILSKFTSTRNAISKFVMCQKQIHQDPWSDTISKPF